MFNFLVLFILHRIDFNTIALNESHTNGIGIQNWKRNFYKQSIVKHCFLKVTIGMKRLHRKKVKTSPSARWYSDATTYERLAISATITKFTESD